MKNTLKALTAWIAVLAIVTGILPLEPLCALAAYAQEEQTAQQAASTAQDGFEGLLTLVGEKEEQTDGPWRYVVAEEDNYAIVTGYDGTAGALRIPDVLGGADTVAVAPGALASVPELRSVTVPGNVMAIGGGAFPRGAVLSSTNASYAQTWARKNGHAFSSTSDLDFRPGVVDFTGIREENFNRVSANEVWLRALEAKRVRVGSRFFLADPSDLYQISFYEVTAMTARRDGFVVLTCATPEVTDVFTSISGSNQEMRIDMSTLSLSRGVEYDHADKLSGSFDGIKVPLKIPLISKGLGDYSTFQATGSYSVSCSGDYSFSHFGSGNYVNVKQVTAFKGSLKLSAERDFGAKGYEDKVKLFEDGMAAGKHLSDEQETDASTKDIQALNALLSEALPQKGLSGESTAFDMPVARFTVFSLYGIISAAVETGLKLEYSGSFEVSISYSNTVYHRFDISNHSYSKRNGGTESSFAGEIKVEIKVGFKDSLAIYFGWRKIGTCDLFAGVCATASIKAEFVSSDQSDSNIWKFNINMADCIDIEVNFVVELSCALSILPKLQFSPQATLVDLPLSHWHWHILGHVLEYSSYEQRWLKAGDKDKLHDADTCPYNTKTATFLVPEIRTLDNVFRQVNNLLPGEELEPSENDVADFRARYDRLLISWHTDESLDEASEVKWPLTVQEDLTLWAKSLPYHTVHFIRSSKQPVSDLKGLTCRDYLGNVKTVDAQENAVELLAGESVVLPDALPDGTPVIEWVEVKGPRDLSAMGSYAPGEAYEVPDTADTAHHLCAVTEKDVHVLLDAQNGETLDLYGARGADIPLPEDFRPVRARSSFVGWRFEDAPDGELVTVVPASVTSQKLFIRLVAEWKDDYTPTADQLGLVNIGEWITFDMVTCGKDELAYSLSGSKGAYEATIKGFSSSFTPRDVEIPRTFNVGTEEAPEWATVTGVSSSAFKDNATLRSISLPDTITSLPSGTFANCPQLELIDIEACAQLTSIPYEFAMNDARLRCVLYPKTVTSIGGSAFSGCASIASARIDAIISWSAFLNCSSLETVTLGGGVRQIGGSAFDGCSALAELTLPDSVTAVGKAIIYGCTGLKKLRIEGGSGVQTISEGVFSIGKGSQLQELELTDGVKTLREKAFANGEYGFPMLTTVKLPRTLTTLESGVFAGAAIEELTLCMADKGWIYSNSFKGLNSLRRVTISAGNIGSNAFAGLPALAEVHLGPGVRKIESGAFADCAALQTVEIENGLSAVGDGAFAGCSSLEALAFPDTVSAYGGGVIEGCRSLTTLTIGSTGENPLKVASSSYRNGVTNPFYIGEENALTTLIISDNVSEIGAFAFANSKSDSLTTTGFTHVTSVSLPAALTKIGRYAFYKLTGLTELALNDASLLSSNAFMNCDIKKVTVKGGSIPDYAFANCAQLTSVTVGDGVTSIGDYAFSNCAQLTSVTVGDDVTSIGLHAFENCTGLTSLSFPDSVTNYGSRMIMGCTNLEYLRVGGGISVLTNDNTLYYDDYNPFYIGAGSHLKTLVLGEGITKLDHFVFANTLDVFSPYNLYYFPELTSVTLPSTLTSLGSRAFTGSGIRELTLASGLASEAYSFEGLNSLEKVTVKGGAIGYHAFRNLKNLKEVVLEDGVTSIGIRAFENCTSLTSLSFPDSVTSYGSHMIAGCTNLEYLRVGGGVPVLTNDNSLDSDSYNPFYIGAGSHLKTLVLGEGITKLDHFVFANTPDVSSSGNNYCFPELTSLTLPSTLTSLGSRAFAGSKIRELTLASGLASEAYSFEGLNSLEKITVKGGAIGYHAFRNLKNLKEAVLEDGVTSIGIRAFENCTSLTSLSFPDSVTYYGSAMIAGCTNLEYLRVGGGVPVLTNDHTLYYDSNNPFYIGAGSHLKTLVLGEGITKLDHFVFANTPDASSSNNNYCFRELTFVTLPSTLTSLGEGAFAGSKIRELTLASGMASPYESFVDMDSLEKVTVKGGAIGAFAFRNLKNLREVVLEDGVTSIGNNAFENCTGLTSLSFPDSVTYYGRHMIMGCTNLEYLRIGGGVSVLTNDHTHTSYVYNPFYIGAGSHLKTLVLGEGITELDQFVFANTPDVSSSGNNYCFRELTSVTLPSTLTTLGAGAFAGSKIRELTLASGLASAYESFVGLDSLEKVTVKGGAIGAFAFRNLKNLKEVVLEDGVTSIGNNAFENCTGLTSLSFPDSVTYYGRHMIMGCINLEYLRIGGGVSVLTNDNTHSSYTYNPFYIGYGSHLKTLVLGEGITKLDQFVFANTFDVSSSSNTYYFPELTSVTLPSTLTSLGEGNLHAWCANGQVRTLRMPSHLDTLSETGALPADLVLYSDEESALLADFAAQKGIAYKVGGREIYPSYPLRFVAPGWALNLRGLTVSDGSIRVTRGTEGEEALLPEGYVILSETEAVYLDALTLEDLPVLAGHTFMGWYADPDFLQPWREDMRMPSAELTLYAKVIPPIEVTYAIRAEVGEADETLPEGYTRFAKDALPYGSEVVPPELPDIEGLYFTGWYRDPNGSIPWDHAPVTEALTLYAVYKPQTRVRYAVNLASIGTQDETLPHGFALYASLTATPGDPLPLPKDPVCDDYTFIGWYLDDTLIADALPERTPLHDITFYGNMERSSAGAVYRKVEDGLELTHYVRQQDESAEVHLPASVGGVPVVSIADGAFAGSGVQTLYLPSLLRRVAPEAFSGSGIKLLYISGAAEHFSSVNGVLYNKDRTELLIYPANRQSPSYTLAPTTERIAARAFASNAHLKTAVFPDGLMEIGEAAFRGCRALTDVALPDSVTTLRQDAFAECIALASFSAYGLVTIEDGVENGQPLKRTIPMGVRATGPLADGVLRSYFLVDNGAGGFMTYNYNQHMVTLHLEDAQEYVGCEAGLPLSGSLKNIELSDGTIIYDWYKDSECTQPWNMDADLMPREDMHLYAKRTRPFDSTTGTATDAEGNEVTGVILTACNLRAPTITVPAVFMDQPVVALDAGFLASCTGVGSVSIPGSVVSIADTALSDASGNAFTGVIVCDADSYAAAWAGEKGITTDIRVYRLSYVTGGLPIPAVEAGKGFAVPLPTPDHGTRVFAGWYLDAECTLPAPADEEGIFTMPGADTVLYAFWEGEDEIVPYTYTLTGGGVTVTGYTGHATRVAVPASINGWPVTAIGESAFAERAELYEISLPETVTAVGWGAFAGCASLSSLTLPDSVTSLGEKAFARCTALKTLNIGAGLRALDPSVVENCARLNALNVAAGNGALRSVDGIVFDKDGTRLILYPAAKSGAYAIPEGVTEIGGHAFGGAKGLTGVTVPGSVETIGEAAFSNTGLTAIALGGVKTVGDGAFRSCMALQTVSFAEGLESLGSFAFLSCPRLERVTLPASLTLAVDAPIFGSTDPLTICGQYGSSAYLYAKNNRIAFEDPDALQVEQIAVTPDKLTLERGDSQPLTVSLSPADAEFGTSLVWSSSNTNVAIVDGDGVVRAIGGGSATICVTTDNGLTATIPVEVTVAVTSLTLAPFEGESPIGAVLTVEPTLLPGTATDKRVTWASADESVATVDESGLITCAGVGETVITATAHNGITAETTVAVYKPVESLTLTAEEKELYAIDGMNTLQLTATVLPADATYTGLTWTSSDGCISVSDSGLVTALRPGTAVVTVTGEDPSRPAATLEITVSARDLSGLEVGPFPPVVYDGNEHIPECTLTLDDRTLTPGVDYTVSGSAVNAGDNELTITGMGAYCGAIEIIQTIERAQPVLTWNAPDTVWPDMLSALVTVEPACIAPAISFSRMDADGAPGESVPSPTETGRYQVTVLIEATDNYDGANLTGEIDFVAGEELTMLPDLTLMVGQTVTLPVSARLESIAEPVYSLSSDDSTVATTDALSVTALKGGACTLRLTVEGSEAAASCALTVADSLRTAGMPAALTEIGEEAFEGDALFERVLLGEHVRTIGPRAFANMTALQQIEIPASVTDIAADALRGTDTVILCEEGSAAEAYAKRHGIRYVIR